MTTQVMRQAHQRGFVLLPVVLALTLLAVIAWLLNHQGVMGLGRVNSTTQIAQAEHVARSGLAHASWQASNGACNGDQAIASSVLGSNGSYTATIDSPATTTTVYTFTADRDTWIKEAAPADNKASDVTLSVKNTLGDSFRTLYHFDLSSIPAGARVVSATLRLFTDAGDGQGAIRVHPVNVPWTETGADWNTTNNKYDEDVIARLLPRAGASFWTATNLAALVQAWVNTPADNHGIMLMATSTDLESKYFSREGSASERPVLEVTVADAPVSPLSITASATVNGSPSPANDISRSASRSAVASYQPATTAVLQPGVAGKDAFLINGNKADMNTGSGKQVWVSGPAGTIHNGLFEFNLSTIPPGARVLSATLGLYNNSTDAVTAGEISLHRVTTGWLEGTGVQTGTRPADGATFDFHDGVNAWTTPGGDYAPQALATVPVPDLLARWYDFDVTTTVAGWLNGAYPNYGVLVRASGGSVTKLHFVTGDDAADPAEHPKLTITYACECGNPCLGQQASGKILMVVYDDYALTADDVRKKTLFESWGYSVDLIAGWDVQWNLATQAAVNDVIYVAESVDPGGPGVFAVGSTLAGSQLGIVNEEGTLNDALGVSNNAGVTVGSAVTITATGAGHYITEIYPPGTLPIYDANMEQLVVFNGAAPDLQVLAEIGTYPALATLDSGATLKGGGAAAGRRVMLPLGREAYFNWDHLDSAGLQLVQRALAWAKGAQPPQQIILLVVDDAAAPGSKDTGRKALIESWGYAVTLIDDDALLANISAAANAANAVYVSGTVNGGALADKLNDTTTGIVNELAGTLDNFGFSSGTGDSTNSDAFTSTDAGHYITEPYAGAAVTVFTAPLAMSVVATPASNEYVKVGKVSSNGALATLENGANRWDNTPSPGRRAHLPYAQAETTQLTADGVILLQRTIEWAAGAGAVLVCNGAYFDQFLTVSYAGSDGNLPWSTDWLETGDPSGAAGGDVQVSSDLGNNRLSVENKNNTITREFSLGGATTATLSLDYRRNALDNSADAVTLEISADGGTNWSPLAVYAGPDNDAAYVSASYDIAAFNAPNTLIRFSTSATLGKNDGVFFDNIRVDCAP